ncbi:transmembrane protein 270 [Nycticebus coucang]|uniref:transmembrane protein 270 n=1 Tax=Nycticebus coucang TaxID=9470 RepID=UPI00234D37DE|nr:transmembrane protein 270 [Nycticebus coucang]
MEASPPVRSSLWGILLQVMRLSVLLVQNRVHLYNFLLLKIILFNHWVLGLAQEAQGSISRQAHPAPGTTACPLGRVIRAGLVLVQVPVWLVLRGSRLVWAGVLGCAWAWGLALLGAWEQLGLSVAIWTDLLLSCLHGLMLVALLLLLLTWRLCQKVQRWLPSKALQENQVVQELLVLLRRLYWWVESTTALTSWHLAYLVTWTTCLASHLLQAAFEHTSQLAQAQEAELQELSGPSLEPLLPESLAPVAGPVLPEQETPGE